VCKRRTGSEERYPIPWHRYFFGAGALPSRQIVHLSMPLIVAACALGDETVGAVGSVAELLAFLAGLVVAYAADRYDLRWWTGLALVSVSAASAWLAASVSLPAFCASLWCTAVGLKIISAGTGFKLIRRDPNPGVAIVRYQFVHVVVTTILPSLAGAILLGAALWRGETAGWRTALAAICLLQIGWLAVVLKTPREDVPHAERPGWGRYRLLIGRGRTYVLMLMAALHVGADGAAFYWVVLLVKRNFDQMNPLQLGLVLSTINSSYLIGRLIMLRRQHRPMGLVHVAALAPVGALAMAAMAFRSPSYGILLALAWLAWFPLSVNWPILQARAVDWFPGAPSAAIGLLGAAATVGVVAAQYAVGCVSEQAGDLAIGFLVPVGMLVALSACAALLHLATRADSPAPTSLPSR